MGSEENYRGREGVREGEGREREGRKGGGRVRGIGRERGWRGRGERETDKEREILKERERERKKEREREREIYKRELEIEGNRVDTKTEIDTENRECGEIGDILIYNLVRSLAHARYFPFHRDTHTRPPCSHRNDCAGR